MGEPYSDGEPTPSVAVGRQQQRKRRRRARVHLSVPSVSRKSVGLVPVGITTQRRTQFNPPARVCMAMADSPKPYDLPGSSTLPRLQFRVTPLAPSPALSLADHTTSITHGLQ